MEFIYKYFPNLTDQQKGQLGELFNLYSDWNEKINVISRRDIENLYINHVLHSISIGKFLTPCDDTCLLDIGTGGGFPGIPLAILWPMCHIHLIDRIGKKIKVAQSIAEAIGLTNVTFQHGDAGECHDKFDFVVSRAVMQLPDLVKIAKNNIATTNRNNYPNGLICLKGGDLNAELAAVKRPIINIPLTDYFTEPYFRTKNLIYVKL